MRDSKLQWGVASVCTLRHLSMPSLRRACACCVAQAASRARHVSLIDATTDALLALLHLTLLMLCRAAKATRQMGASVSAKTLLITPSASEGYRLCYLRMLLLYMPLNLIPCAPSLLLAVLQIARQMAHAFALTAPSPKHSCTYHRQARPRRAPNFAAFSF